MAKKYELDIDISTGGSLNSTVKALEKLLKLKQELKGDLELVSDRDIKGITEILNAQSELTKNTALLEKAIAKKKDEEIHTIFQVIRELMSPPEKPKRRIGFHTKQVKIKQKYRSII